MLLVESLKIGAGETAADGSPRNTETAATLHDRLAEQGGRLIVTALQRLDALKPVQQPAEGVTYASKIDKSEAAIDWTQPATTIERRIRAFDPFPGCTTGLGEVTLKLWRARLAAGHGQPGEILAVAPAGITVACGEGALQLTELQKPGGRRLASADFLAGFPLAVGQRLGTH
jgi:methionyl-tRNA formyltransferase